MARDTIKYRLIKELTDQICYGESKKADQDKTNEVRRELKELGVSYRERLEYNCSQEKVYSINTVKTYKREVARFGNWLIQKGLKKISLEESARYVQPYLNSLTERGLTPQSVNTTASALAKALHGHSFHYEKERRSSANVKKSRTMKTPGKENPAWELNKIIGLRRSDLKRLRVNNIHMRNNRIEIEIDKCKGGKTNIQVIYQKDQQEKILEYVHARGLTGNELLFSSDMFGKNVDFQYTRRMAAQECYKDVVKAMQEDPTMREYYQDDIKRIFRESNKPLRENLDSPIYLRGAKREQALANGTDVMFDRTAAMVVSLYLLSHFRTNVTIDNYLT